MLTDGSFTPIKIIDLGHTDYQQTMTRMRQWTLARTEQTPDECWITSHDAVFTLGQNSDASDLLNNPLNIAVTQSDRGGQITYHGPGQIILYLLLDLRRRKMSVKELIYNSEELVIDFLSAYQPQEGQRPHRRSSMPGVYVNNAKLASLGFRVRHGRCYHGISINHSMDLSPFSYINVCGYDNLEVVDLSSLGINISRQQALKDLTQSLTSVL